MTLYSNFFSLHVSIPLFTHGPLFLSLTLASSLFLMDGQIMYIQSSCAPDAVRGFDKSPGMGRWGGVTKQSGGQGKWWPRGGQDASGTWRREKRPQQRESEWGKEEPVSTSNPEWASVFRCLCVCDETKHTPCALPSGQLDCGFPDGTHNNLQTAPT